MGMKTLSLAAAIAIASATAASACPMHETVAQTEVDMKKKMIELAAAQVPVDNWLVKYLEDWQKA